MFEGLPGGLPEADLARPAKREPPLLGASAGPEDEQGQIPVSSVCVHERLMANFSHAWLESLTDDPAGEHWTPFRKGRFGI